MQFQKLSLSITLTALAVATQQHLATASPASYASTRYDVLLQQLELDQPQLNQSPVTQAQTIQTQLQKSTTTNRTGQTFFSHPPTLIRVESSQRGVSTPSTYEFTLTVPQDAGQPLKAVTINQAENVETIKFNVSDSKAYVGGRLTADSEIRLASIGGDQPAISGQGTIVFDQPVSPGSTVTIALSAQKNPASSGIYLFGVTAYPDGENGLGQFLGYRRIHFSGNSN
ncbi:DUF2808 domain-containing protein [Cyanobacteria bacterium FACHB-63]|nr:DUF2808 domain-containing protein [Cyanobacteria bacterium FACHB-63]